MKPIYEKLSEIVAQLKFGEYKNAHGGDLSNNIAFVALEKMAERKKVVQQISLVTGTYANQFLASIPHEDIISVTFHQDRYESQMDESISIVYKTLVEEFK